MDDITEQADAAGVSTAARKDPIDANGRMQQVPRGILCMIVATVLFSIAFALSKWQVAIYPAGEVLFLRSFSSLVVVLAVMLPVTGIGVFATRRPRDHVL